MTKKLGLKLIACLALCWTTALPAEPVVVEDDLGRRVELAEPARRIVSLAPHIAENLFSAGAGGQLVGVVDYSNFPAEAQKIPSVGGYSRFNLEAIVALKPDLIIAWRGGNGMDKIQQMMALGYTVYVSEPKTLEDIAASLERYGRLTGNEVAARAASRRFNQTLYELRQAYSGREPVSVFYQVWNKPLYTVTDKHLISDVMRLCGGRNVFANIKLVAPSVSVESAPQISVESILAVDPQVIIASGMGEARPEWLDEWRQWPSLQAVKNQHLYFIPPELVQRHSVRILSGAKMMCEHLQRARQSYR